MVPLILSQAQLQRMTTISDLPPALVEEILSMVLLTSLGAVRCTCKEWNAFSKDVILCKTAAKKPQFLRFMMMDYRLWSMKIDLDSNEGCLVEPFVKQIGEHDQIKISRVFHCDGLVLCVTKDYSRLLVWNPYLGQTNWIQPRNDRFQRLDMYAVGCENKRVHKILRVLDAYVNNDRNIRLKL